MSWVEWLIVLWTCNMFLKLLGTVVVSMLLCDCSSCRCYGCWWLHYHCQGISSIKSVDNYLPWMTSCSYDLWWLMMSWWLTLITKELLVKRKHGAISKEQKMWKLSKHKLGIPANKCWLQFPSDVFDLFSLKKAWLSINADVFASITNHQTHRIPSLEVWADQLCNAKLLFGSVLSRRSMPFWWGAISAACQFHIVLAWCSWRIVHASAETRTCLWWGGRRPCLVQRSHY